MHRILQDLKATAAHRLKYGRYALQGHRGKYAARQEAPGDAFGHVWCDLEVVIRMRGNGPEVNASRIWNMKLAASYFDGLVVEPGQIVGFWERVPAPRRRNRFREGPAFIRNVVTRDVGGGLCQISTALYKLFLRAGFEVIERHNHSIDAYGAERYFILGQDATLSYGYKDLIARNDTGVPVQLRMAIDDANPVVRVSLHGRQPMPGHVSIETQIVDELPAVAGNTRPGWRVETVRTVERPGDRRVLRYVDVYRPHAG
ncbi:MAG: VanW family protein [Rhodothermales bacterium]